MAHLPRHPVKDAACPLTVHVNGRAIDVYGRKDGGRRFYRLMAIWRPPGPERLADPKRRCAAENEA